jgi:serine phosphatase RsbU (regulator of sigma subunit)
MMQSPLKAIAAVEITMNPSLAGPLAQSASLTLLPVEWSQFDGVDLYARNHAECRGGDFFDGIAVGHRVIFLLTDIAGPRLEAHAVALALQATFREKAQEIFAAEAVNESDALAELAHVANVALVEAADGVRLAPTFIACFNKTLGILSYCNAGNLLALVRAGDDVAVLQSGGMPLGLFTHTTFEAAVLALQPEDTLLVVTKGVIESRRGSTEFGTERVERLLKESTSRSAPELCEAVLQQAYDHANDPWSRILGFFHSGERRRQDDLTALALIRRTA